MIAERIILPDQGRILDDEKVNTEIMNTNGERKNIVKGKMKGEIMMRGEGDRDHLQVNTNLMIILDMEVIDGSQIEQLLPLIASPF